MSQDEKKVNDFLHFIIECEPSDLAETLRAKGIPVDNIFINHLALVKCELSLAKSTAFLNKTREQAVVAEYLSEVIDKTTTQAAEVRGKNFAVAELEISYKNKRKNNLFVDGANMAYQVFREMWDHSLINIQEQLCALYLNASGAVIGYRLLSTGTAKSCLVDFNIMVSFALLSRAAGVILAHNHPSGNLQFSKADTDMTVAAQKMLSQFEIKVLDHLIVSEDDYFSMKNNRVIAFN